MDQSRWPGRRGDGNGEASPASGAYERAVACLSRQYENYLDATCSEFGVTGSQVPLLMYLWDGNVGATQNQIARALGVDKGTVSRNVRALVKAGLVTQTACQRDTRACEIGLTEAGQRLADPITGMSHRWTAAVTAGLNARQRGRLLGHLADMADRAVTFASGKSPSGA